MNRSRSPSLSMSKKAAHVLQSEAFPRTPAASVTSANLPPPRLRKSRLPPTAVNNTSSSPSLSKSPTPAPIPKNVTSKPELAVTSSQRPWPSLRKRAGGGLGRSLGPRPVSAIDKKKVRIAVIIEINEGHASTHRFRQKLVSRRSAVMPKRDAAGCRHVGEPNFRHGRRRHV